MLLKIEPFLMSHMVVKVHLDNVLFLEAVEVSSLWDH
jgi:hypothetical protein